MGAEKAKHQFEVLYEKIIKRFEAPTPPAQMPGKEEGREESDEGQEQRKASRQVGPPARFARFRGATGECGGSGNFNAPYDRKRSLSSSPRGERRPMEEDGILKSV